MTIDYNKDTNMVTKQKKCSVTGKQYRVSVSIVEFENWQRGDLIQSVWPDMEADDREFLISGFTPEEWEQLIGSDDEN